MAAEPNYPASFYARLFNLTERRIQQLAQDGTIPKASRGKYPLIGSIQGYVKYLQERTLGTEAAPTDLQSERTRLTKASADKVEIEVDILKGTSILASVVEAFQSRMISAFRAKCLSLPTKTAPRLAHLTDLAEIESELRTAVYDALSELSEFRYSDYGIRAIQQFDSDDSAAAESDGEPVG